jgi:hypothetical protein
MFHFVETAEFGKFTLKEIHCYVDMGRFNPEIWDSNPELRSLQFRLVKVLH